MAHPTAEDRPQPVVLAPGRLYRAQDPYMAALARVTVGLSQAPHGTRKLSGTLGG